MSVAETPDDEHPYETHLRREPLPGAGVKILFLAGPAAAAADPIVGPIVAWLQAAGRSVAVQTITPDGPSPHLNEAVRTALDNGQHPLVLITTAVEPWSPAHLEPLLEAIDRCDHAVGRRPAASWRRVTRWIGSLARRLIFAVPVLDVHSPCQLHRTEKLAAIPLQSGSSFLDLEILAKATFLGHLLSEVEVPALAGWAVRKGRWRDLSVVLRRPEFRQAARAAASVPAEDTEGQIESSDRPGCENDDRLEDVVMQQPRALEDDQSKRIDELGQGERLDEGWAFLPKFSVAKKTPESRYIGSMTRFMSPLTVSVVVARLATSSPMPAKARAPRTSIRKKTSRLPRIGMLKASTPSNSRMETSGIKNVRREARIAPRKSRLGMGVAMKHLSSLPIRKLTRKKPIPQSPPPMALTPIRPGISRSMYRVPGLVTGISMGCRLSSRPAASCKTSSITCRAAVASGRVGS